MISSNELFVEHLTADAALVAATGDRLPKPEYVALAEHVINRLAGYQSCKVIRQQDIDYLARILQATGGWHGDGACIQNPCRKKTNT